MAETAVIPPNNHVIPSSPVSHRHVKPAKPKSIGLYKLGRTLGEGTYGKVKLGTHMYTGQEVAIKIMRPHETNNRQEVEREIAVLKLLKHPNIVQLFEVIEEESSGRIFLVLELVAGGELFDYIVARGRVKEKEARKFFRQIISGVEYCHANLVVHRDLKPENLLLDADGNVKINDFGFSNLISPGKLFSTFCGSPIYAPPEIILEKEYLGPGVDIWSMGVILYALVNGQLPWRLGKNGRIIDIEKLLAGQFECSPSSNLSKSVKDLMSRMIVADPKNRASLAEVRNHPWISEGYDSPPPCMLAARPPVTQVKEDVLNQLVLIGFDREGARAAILTNEISPAVTTYHLLLEKAGYTVPSAAAPPVPSVTPVITQELAASPSPPSPSVGARPPTSPDPRRPTSPSRRLSMDLRVRPPIIGPGVLTPISEDGSDSHKTAASVSPSAVPASPVAPAPIVTRRGRAHTITSVMVPSGLGIHAASGPAAAAPAIERPGLANIAIPPHITHTDGTHSAPGSPQTKTRRNSILSIFKKSPAVEKPSMVVPVAAAPLTPTAAAAIAAAAAAATNAALPQTPPGPPGSAPKRRLSLQALPVPWSPSKAPVKEKLREIKGVFNVDTTTLKPADQIVAEVVRVLEDSAIEFKQKGYIFKCKQKQPIDKTERVQFDLEICQIQGLNMNGVRFKRISGGVWGYRTLCQALMQKMKL